jgi:hypothetical protein
VDTAALVEALCPRCRERLAAEAAYPALLRSALSAWRDLSRGADLPSNAAASERMNDATWWKALQQALERLDDDA